MKLIHGAMVAFALVLAFGTPGAVADSEEEVPLSEVPQVVLDAAQQAVPGITLTEAELERTENGPVYEIEGEVDGQEYEIEVTAAGEVLEVERGDDVDDEGDVEDEEEEDAR